MKHLIVGNSAAGLFAAEEIRRRDKDSRITLLTSEFYPSYSRCLTTYFLAGDISQSQLYLRSLELPHKLDFHIEFMAEVIKLNAAWKKVLTRDGREWSYDRLLIASGSSAVKLGVPGEFLPQVFSLRTMDDAIGIEQNLEWGKRSVIIGGGLVSLKSAYALIKRGLKVTIVVSSNQILSQILDSQSASLLQNHLEEHGLKIILEAQVKSILGKETVQAVELLDGRILWADLVIVGKGVKPNIKPFLSSGIKVNQGIVVNQFLETSIPDIFAAGDCAEAWDIVQEKPKVNATWPNATTQGKFAGANMTGAKLSYAGSLSMNAVDFFGLSVISVGMIRPPKIEAELQKSSQNAWDIEVVLKYLPNGMPVFERYVWQGNVLKGYVLLGDTSRAGILTRHVQEGREITRGRKIMNAIIYSG
jgi:nitrite reductase (NADH) large subunit